MTTEITVSPQATTETRTHYIDFTADLPSGVTLSGGTATHTPPSGAATSPVVGAVMSGDILPVTVGPLAVTGRHIIVVTATLSDSQTSVVRLVVPVVWDTARSGMVDLLSELRSLANVGSDDFKVGGEPQFTDGRLQRILDQSRTEHYREEMLAVEAYQGGTPIWKDYYTGVQFLEQTTGGTAVFYIEDGAGQNVGTAQYTMDYLTGKAVFSASTGGSVLYWYGRAYDMNRAAAEVWRRKASYYATQYDFSTDNHRINRSALYKQCLSMAQEFEARAMTASTVTLTRSDVYVE